MTIIVIQIHKLADQIEMLFIDAPAGVGRARPKRVVRRPAATGTVKHHRPNLRIGQNVPHHITQITLRITDDRDRPRGPPGVHGRGRWLQRTRYHQHPPGRVQWLILKLRNRLPHVTFITRTLAKRKYDHG